MNNHLPDGYYSDGESFWAGAEKKEDATMIVGGNLSVECGDFNIDSDGGIYAKNAFITKE